MKYFIFFTSIFVLLLISSNIIHAVDNIFLGVYYFPGWKMDDWHWKVCRDLRKYKNREPITGWVRMDTPEFIKKEIDWAYKYKIDFFAFDWFWNYKKEREHRSYAIHNFIKVNNKLKFCIMWSVHGNLSSDLKKYKPILKTWKDNYLSNPFYFKYNNRPLIFIFDYRNLIKNLGVINIKKLIEKIKKETKAFLVAIDNGPYDNKKQRFILELGFDAISGWNYLGWLKKWYGIKISSYSTYKIVAEKIYNQIYNNSKIPIFPAVLPGWNDSPLRRHPNYILLNNNSKDFKEMLQEAFCTLKYISFNPKIIMVESWNEFGEGSFIMPTKKFRYQFLKQIKNVKEEFKCE